MYAFLPRSHTFSHAMSEVTFGPEDKILPKKYCLIPTKELPMPSRLTYIVKSKLVLRDFLSSESMDEKP